MTATPWNDTVKKGRVINIFPTAKVTGPWLATFTEAIEVFNRLSRTHSLGVTFASPPGVKPPDPEGEGGAEAQFDLGNGTLKWRALGQDFVATEKDENNQDRPINFSPVELHGYTGTLRGSGAIQKAFIFVPATPMISAAKRIGPDNFQHIQRPVGSGIRLFIAVHELVHACGLPNADHNAEGPAADVFTSGITPSAGPFDKPEEDKIRLHLAAPLPNVFAPPITLKKKVIDLIKNNWS